MPDAHSLNSSTLTKLQEVDAELAAQEAQLQSQLESIGEKRRSLKTVISLLTEDTPPPVTKQEVVTSSLEESLSQTTDNPTVTPPVTKTEMAKKAPSSFKNRKFPQAKPPVKATRGSSAWQQYVKQEYQKLSLTEAVTLVLQSEVERTWNTSDVFKKMFNEILPLKVASKIRHQISNVLGEGARDNKWYRGKLGSYSLSRREARAKNFGGDEDATDY